MDVATIGAIIGILAYWEIREVFTSHADKRRSKHPRTAKIAMRMLLPLIGVLLIGQLVTEASLSVPLNVTDTTETIVELIGAVIFWSGIACAVWSRETLGKHWAHAADYQIVPGQTLVTHGPYRWVRHPMYTALLAIFTGVQVMLASWLVILSLPLYGVMVWQGRKEEVLLTEAFGHTYRAYQKRTGMIWPRLS
jgi:protein-S-isoprenylcysteine O-methyltransferase Ste14